MNRLRNRLDVARLRPGPVPRGLSLLIAATLVAGAGFARAEIAIDGRYWQYQGERVLLIGGWNHGHNPFIDHDTDDDRDNQGVSTPEQIADALDQLAEAGGNALRCVLNPGMAAAIQGMNFCAKTDAGYDLERMGGAFWDRLDTFIAEARKRDIIVQLEVWDRFDLIDGSWGAWPGSPWNPQNNVNYTVATSGLKTSYGGFGNHPFLTGVPGHPEYEGASPSRRRQYDVVRGYQDHFVDKLLDVTFRYDNVLYCMNNETHVHPAWGEYWIKRIQAAARSRNKNVLTTDMFDNVYNPEDSRGLAHQFAHPDLYHYVDASQANSRHRDQAHWEKVRWIVETASKLEPPRLVHMTKIYGNDLALAGQPWSAWRPGDTDNAIEEWWRNLIAGVAGVRFHRPTAGIGLSPQAQACLRATRKIESKVKFWDVAPRLDLLSDRDADEAYLGADPGRAYLLYFTKNGGGSVGLDLAAYPGATFEIAWVNIDTGEWGSRGSLSGGASPTVARPDGTAHWVAVIVR